MSFTHAVTIDTDGQHDPRDIVPLLQLAKEQRQALVVGTRPISDDYPARSHIGRAISNFFVHLESGARVDDSQCGLRVYPLRSIARVRTYADRYGFETEVLTRFAWARLPIAQAPIRCIYEIAGGRTTHFRAVRDSVSAVFMHMRLVTRSMIIWPIERIGTDDSIHTGTIIARLARWMSPLRVWRQVRADHAARKRFAASFSTGVTIATLPPFGLKTVLCFALSRWFGLEPVVVISASSLNTPPIGPMLWLISIATGHAILHGDWPTLQRYDFSRAALWPTLRAIGLEWIVGSIVLGAVLWTISFVLLRAILHRMAIDEPSPQPTP